MSSLKINIIFTKFCCSSLIESIIFARGFVVKFGVVICLVTNMAQNRKTRRVVITETNEDLEALQKEGFCSPAFGYIVTNCNICLKPKFFAEVFFICDDCAEKQKLKDSKGSTSCTQPSKGQDFWNYDD